MKALIESILQGYGSLVTVRDGQSARTFRALVQPVTEKGWASTRKLIESLGRVPKGQYVYIGPAEMEIKQGQTVEVRQEAYVVRRSETMALGEQAEPLALLRPPRQVQVAEVRPQRSRPYRPASTIDDAVRQRAYEAVARTLAIGNG